jgi:hypothetical protein
MVSPWAAAFLSPAAALGASVWNDDFLCYKEGSDSLIVLRELLDKGMWKIPKDTDKVQYEKRMNESLQRQNPKYWKAREKSLTENAMPDARKDIIFRGEDYKEKFRIKDGESIKVTAGYDGEVFIVKCRWIDEAHIKVCSDYYHNREFMERHTRSGNVYEPILGQAPKIDVLIEEPGKPPRNAEILMSFAALKEMLGGELVITNLYRNVASIAGENGNGIIVICELAKGNITSLHQTEEIIYKRDFKTREAEAAKENNTDISTRLAEGKEKADTHNKARPPQEKPNRSTITPEH